MTAVTLRFAGLYGPGRVVRRALIERGEPIPGDPVKMFNLIHIEDAAAVALDGALGSRHPSLSISSVTTGPLRGSSIIHFWRLF